MSSTEKQYSENELINVFVMLTERLGVVEDMLTEVKTMQEDCMRENILNDTRNMRMLAKLFNDDDYKLFKTHWDVQSSKDPVVMMKRVLKFLEPHILRILDLVYDSIYHHETPLNEVSLIMTNSFMYCTHAERYSESYPQPLGQIIQSCDFPRDLLKLFISKSKMFVSYCFDNPSSYGVEVSLQDTKTRSAPIQDTVISIDDFVGNPDDYPHVGLLFETFLVLYDADDTDDADTFSDSNVDSNVDSNIDSNDDNSDDSHV